MFICCPRIFEFDGEILQAAITSTFARRKTAVPKEAALAFTKEFSDDPTKQARWKAFSGRVDGLSEMGFEQVIHSIAEFVTPVFRAISNAEQLRLTWKAKHGWKRPSS